MIHFIFRAYIAGSCRKTIITTKNVGKEGIIQIGSRQQRVKRPLCQSPFRAKTGCRRRFPGNAANKIDKQLGQFLIMNGIVYRQWWHIIFGLGRIVAPSGKHGIYRQAHRLIQWDFAENARAYFSHILRYRVNQIRTDLQVTRIFRRDAINQPRLRRHHQKLGAIAGQEIIDQIFHRLRVQLKADGIVFYLLHLLTGQRFKVRQESIRARQVLLTLFVVPFHDTVIGALEKPRLAIPDNFHTRIAVLRIKIFQFLCIQHNRGGNIIFELHFG